MQVVFKTYFLHVKFHSSMCQVYFIKGNVDLFFGDAF